MYEFLVIILTHVHLITGNACCHHLWYANGSTVFVNASQGAVTDASPDGQNKLENMRSAA
jgi:hypothetical protein